MCDLLSLISTPVSYLHGDLTAEETQRNLFANTETL